MRRSVIVMLAAMILSSCTAFVDSVQQTAQARFQQFLANQFSQRLEAGIDLVISRLAMKGGFLDDPLVRILLPPPLGLVIGVARDLQKDPQAALLEALINQAAENTIPVAGPVLKDIVMNMDTLTLENLLDAGDTAATDYLKQKGGAAVQGVLLPAITEQLHANGAVELYGELLKAKETADQVAATAAEVQQQVETAQEQIEVAQEQVATAQEQVEAVQSITQKQLGQYVAERAAAGLFDKLANEELSIHRSLESLHP